MKRVIFTLLLLAAFNSYSQNWQLVWSDEFNGSISPDWVFETGRGASGWGNNELQYYRRENATVQNGHLVITARRENFGGAQYTSARMKTQGKKSWKYGRMEARISMPAFQGVWPAFWMLGDNISSVGWPACGEIDVMEHVNAEHRTYGTIHWRDQNGNYANYGGNVGVNNITGFHNYAVEWDENRIQWFLDGVKYHEVNIAGGVNGTHEFHNNYFLLLNMAIGGNWPGFSVDNGAFPAQMRVDYVRVYTRSNTPTGDPGLAGTYYLRNRHSNKYMDVGGWSTEPGGNIIQWDYHGGNNQKFRLVHLGSGTYRIESVHSGHALDVGGWSTSNGANILQWNAHNGANQQFVAIPVGNGYYKLLNKHSNKLIEVAGWSTSNGGNIQQWQDGGQTSAHWQLVPAGGGGFEKVIQAESYSAMAGVQLEGTSDAGGGQNVGWIDAGDWMAYNGINFPASGAYKIEYRVASPGGAQLSADLNAGSIQLGNVGIPATGGWQNWTTVSHTVNVNAGTYNFGIYAPQSGWNINWIKITQVSGAKMSSLALEEEVENPITVFPNPAFDRISVAGAEASDISIVDMYGDEARISFARNKSGSASADISDLVPGVYMIKVLGHDKMIRFLKE